MAMGCPGMNVVGEKNQSLAINVRLNVAGSQRVTGCVERRQSGAEGGGSQITHGCAQFHSQTVTQLALWCVCYTCTLFLVVPCCRSSDAGAQEKEDSICRR